MSLLITSSIPLLLSLGLFGNDIGLAIKTKARDVKIE